MQVGNLLATLLVLFSFLSTSWATKGIHEIHEEITYLGPSLYATCSKISGEVIIVYDLQKTESVFMYNRDIPWSGPQMQLIIQPKNQPGEFILDDDVRGKHLPTGIQVTHRFFDIFVRGSSQIFLRFQRGRCIHFQVKYE